LFDDAVKDRPVLKEAPDNNRPTDPCLTCETKERCAFIGLPTARPLPFPSVLTRYGEDRPIIEEGEPVTGLHVMCRGAAIVTAMTAEGARFVLHLVGTGGILDAPDVLAERPSHSVSARALTDALVLFVRLETAQARLREDPALIAKLCHQAGSQLYTLQERYIRLQSQDTSRRVVQALLELAHACGRPQGRSLVLPLVPKRSLLAQIAGTTPETISRMMSSLRRRRLVRTRKGTLVIGDVKKLQALKR
jgi:CRP/FNR family transcriptional regulator